MQFAEQQQHVDDQQMEEDTSIVRESDSHGLLYQTYIVSCFKSHT